MRSKRVQAVVLATAIVAGYAGAAAFSAWGLPAVPVATGWVATRERFVDDEVAAREAAGAVREPDAASRPG